MTVNYFIKCPVCSAVTRMRSPAGYVYKTPVRIHCGKCETLLTGDFVSDNDKIQAYYVPNNCEEVRFQDYEYYGEASGELLCNKVEYLPGSKDDFVPPTISPALRFLDVMELDAVNEYINFACHMQKLSKVWDSQRILYDLYLRKQYDLIKEKYCDDSKSCGYDLDTEYNIHRYIYFTYIYNFGGLFAGRQLNALLHSVNYEINHLNVTELDRMILNLRQIYQICTCQKKLFAIMHDYVDISQNVMPALGALFYKDPETIDKETVGLSTCSFEDIKSFYQNAFESLMDSADIIAGLDNIKYRNDYTVFTSGLTMDKFANMKKGAKIKELNCSETFSGLFDLDRQSNQLRNAIGHNNYTYDGVRHMVIYSVSDKTPDVKTSIYLLDIAMNCISLMRSSFVMNIILLKLIQRTYRTGQESLLLHPIFYAKAKGGDHCPCGSGIKYKNCCKEAIESGKKSIKQIKLPYRDYIGLTL